MVVYQQLYPETDPWASLESLPTKSETKSVRRPFQQLTSKPNPGFILVIKYAHFFQKKLNVLMKYFKKYILVALLMKSTIFTIKDRNTVKNILLLFKKLRMRLAFLCIINLTLMLTRLPTPGYCSQISFRAMLSTAFICPACQYYQKPSLNIDLLSRLFSQEPCEERIPSSASCYGQEMVKSAPPHSVLIYTLHLTG